MTQHDLNSKAEVESTVVRHHHHSARQYRKQYV